MTPTVRRPVAGPAGQPTGRRSRRIRWRGGRPGPAAGSPVAAGRSRAADDRGSATAELAAGLPAVVLLLLVALTAVGAVTTRLQCVDAARETALAAARGAPGGAAARPFAPEGAEISVTVAGDTVTATVSAPVPLLGARLPVTVDAAAVAAVEPGLPGPRP